MCITDNSQIQTLTQNINWFKSSIPVVILRPHYSPVSKDIIALSVGFLNGINQMQLQRQRFDRKFRFCTFHDSKQLERWGQLYMGSIAKAKAAAWAWISQNQKTLYKCWCEKSFKTGPQMQTEDTNPQETRHHLLRVPTTRFCWGKEKKFYKTESV